MIPYLCKIHHPAIITVFLIWLLSLSMEEAKPMTGRDFTQNPYGSSVRYP